MRLMMRATAVVLVLAGLSEFTSAGQVFDNSPGFDASFSTMRGPGNSPTTFISDVDQDTAITNIAVYDTTQAAGQFKFLIYDLTAQMLLLSTDPQSFAADSGSSSWKMSNSFAFTLLAGHQYDIGAVANVNTAVPVSRSQTSYTQSGITSEVGNDNFVGYDDPTDTEVHACCAVLLQLYGPDAVATPEPSTIALVVGGMPPLLFIVYRQRRWRVTA